MTASVFAKIMLLGLLEPVVDQNLYFLGMKYTTATFATAMANVTPDIAFVMACFLADIHTSFLYRLENVKLTSKHSHAKIICTSATVGGAMIMMLVQGPSINLPWMEAVNNHTQNREISVHNSIKGALMITVGCFSWACFMILQVTTVRAYPAEFSLTAWICLLGMAEGAILALVMEKEKAAWCLKWDTNLLAAVYSGILCSGLAYYVQGVVLNERGPVFVTAFSPLGMLLVAIFSSFILAEEMHLGRVIGAIVIIIGLYLVVRGKRGDYKSPSIEEQGRISVNMEEEVIYHK